MNINLKTKCTDKNINPSIYPHTNKHHTKTHLNQAEILFKLKNIDIAHRDKKLLKLQQLVLPRNKLVAFIGPNGAGKSTLLHAILGQGMGVGLAVQGDIRSQGQSVAELLRQGKIAWVGQHERFELPFTVLDYALLGVSPNLAWYQKPKPKHVLQAKRLLESFELQSLENERVQTLSGGEKQRLAIVRALMQDTEILLLDEPCNHLDIRHQRLLLNFLRQLVKEQQKSIIVVLHDLVQTYYCADEVVLLNKGGLVAQGSPDEVMTQEQLTEVYQTAILVKDNEYGRTFDTLMGSGYEFG